MTDGDAGPSGRVQVKGTISSVAFGGGDRFVVGHWPVSPVGPMHDVMWADPSGHRRLLAPTSEAADFITRIYDFDEVCVDPFDAHSDGRRTVVDHERVRLDLRGGRLRPVPFPRPLLVTRFIEAPIARAMMGVEAHGTSPRGATEWYQSRGWRWIVDANGSLDGDDLGTPVEFAEPVGVGFSEPPSRPSIVTVHVSIDLP